MEKEKYANIRVEKEAYDKLKKYCKKNDKVILKVFSKIIDSFISKEE